jgi:hypothetical protein
VPELFVQVFVVSQLLSNNQPKSNIDDCVSIIFEIILKASHLVILSFGLKLYDDEINQSDNAFEIYFICDESDMSANGRLVVSAVQDVQFIPLIAIFKNSALVIFHDGLKFFLSVDIFQDFANDSTYFVNQLFFGISENIVHSEVIFSQSTYLTMIAAASHLLRLSESLYSVGVICLFIIDNQDN